MVLKEILVLSPQYGKIVNCDIMARDVKMVMYGDGALRCSLYLSSKDTLIKTSVKVIKQIIRNIGLHLP